VEVITPRLLRAHQQKFRRACSLIFSSGHARLKGPILRALPKGEGWKVREDHGSKWSVELRRRSGPFLFMPDRRWTNRCTVGARPVLSCLLPAAHQTRIRPLAVLLVIGVLIVGLLAWAGVTAVEEQQTRQRRADRDLDMRRPNRDW
jgi:hypothetical protein